MSKFFVAGASGFLGSHLMEALGGEAVNHTHGKRFDFRHSQQAFSALCESGARVIFNCAARVGGIKHNQDYPGETCEDNLLIGINLMRAFSYMRLDKFVQIGTVCSYPRHAPIPTSEEEFWNGRPEETNAPYGLAKRALVAHGQSLSAQFKLSIIHPILANLYGPGDKYDGDNNHVIPAMVRKFVDAAERGDKSVTLWGSGECSREFLFVKDAADALMFLYRKYDSPEIVNVSSGEEIKIRDLAEKIADLAGFKGDIRWDRSKPDGQPRRHWGISKLAKLGWSSNVRLSDGLRMTVEDYTKSRSMTK